MSVLVEIRNLSKVYERGRQKVEVLHHVNLDIQKGDFLALMGPSGSGKTTLLNLIGGLDSPTEGTISIAGKRIDDLSEGALNHYVIYYLRTLLKHVAACSTSYLRV